MTKSPATSKTIRLATAAELVERDKLTYTAWGEGLSQTQFLEREQRLRNHRWAKENMKTWLLCDDSGILTSCEMFRMQSHHTSHKTPNGQTFGIASVYTEPKLRGHGYASEMIEKICTQIKATETTTHAYILYSEVGAAIYQRIGFSTLASNTWIFDTANALSDKIPPTATPDAIPKLLQYFSKSDYRIVPTAEQIDWHWERERIYAELLNRQSLSQRIFYEAQTKSFAIWTADFKNNILFALAFHSANHESTLELIEAGRQQAIEAGLKQIHIWDSPNLFDPASRHQLLLNKYVRTNQRNDSLAMIMPKIELADITRAIWV